jgi:hypothetical protein
VCQGAGVAGAGAARTVRRGKGAGAAKARKGDRRGAAVAEAGVRSGGRGQSGSSARGKSTTTPTSAGSGNQDPVLRRDMFIKGRLRYAQQGWK